ncbi:hypothetical protein ACQKLP_12400 [Chitinophaga sp. NPDC101104]|uniref:hypothetical protein n=1 Tax=Chitinophaga sp. NPDC101104 TaxID=3390561 RepID=UPI003D035BD0
MSEVIIDTNIPLVAGGYSDMPDSCRESCIQLIDEIIENKHIVIIDNIYKIIGEYENKIQYISEVNYARQFLKWVYTNQGNDTRIRSVELTEIAENEYEEFPDEIEDFDHSDRKFVAVAIANDYKAPIYQASDSKWIGWEQSLNEVGVQVVFLCKKSLAEKFRKKMNR